MLPNWIGIGSARAGTTSLYHIVQQHPDIFIPTQKETGFFNHQYLNENLLAHYESSYFSGVENQKSIGEITPTYMFDDNAIRNIFKALGKVKIITNLRSPIDRAYSHYLFNIKHLTESRPFDKAMTAMMPEIADAYTG
ncbi:MAG: sulfotransferase domain-containing protein [Pseudomonadota bacterium]